MLTQLALMLTLPARAATARRLAIATPYDLQTIERFMDDVDDDCRAESLILACCHANTPLFAVRNLLTTP